MAFLCWLFGCKMGESYEHPHEYGEECPVMFPPVQLAFCVRCGSGPWRVS